MFVAGLILATRGTHRLNCITLGERLGVETQMVKSECYLRSTQGWYPVSDYVIMLEVRCKE